MKTIITIQHTTSQDQTNGMVASWSDWPLTAHGHQEAHQIGLSLKKELGDANFMLYTSDLLRAMQVAERVGACFGFVPHPVPGLRPKHLGSAVGKTNAWLESNQKPRNSDEHPLDYRVVPDAESNREFYDRVGETMKHILKKPDDNIMLVTHGDTLGVLFSMWTNDDPSTYHQHRFSCPPGGVSMLGVDPNHVRYIRKLNDLSYLHPHAFANN